MTSSGQSLGRLSVIGVGLIGGSVAGALKQAGVVDSVLGCGRNASNLDKARELGLIDSWTHDPVEAASAADIVLLAAPVSAVIALLPLMREGLRPDAILTDASSVKVDIVSAARAGLGTRLSRFVPGHPVAGSEKGGAEAARVDLYRDHWTILTPLEETDLDALDRVERLWRETGARVRCMNEGTHDRVLGMISHLPHLVAYALMAQLDAQSDPEDCKALAAGGFYDISRIASSDPVMWRDISLHNRPILRQLIREYQGLLSQLESLVCAGDGERLETWFTRAREVRSTIRELRPRQDSGRA